MIQLGWTTISYRFLFCCFLIDASLRLKSKIIIIYSLGICLYFPFVGALLRLVGALLGGVSPLLLRHELLLELLDHLGDRRQPALGLVCAD